ncbi:2-phospho-L-lactate guanylyltransferase [Phycicoccus flavus]|uniref:2-phospho-L-lactate guanylyltransferase n=1 Tax=Phycicoccus flavus TaxID=2502783 RepID=UPI00197B689E|nr:2-phospho-L-lactate guanylyltransferase [Phycicoccus flavus]
MALPPRVAVVVPVKGGPLAKSRLALPHEHRTALADAFARDTVAAVREGLPYAPVLVVTADPLVALWAQEAGCRAVMDPGGGLDAAVAAGVEVAGSQGGATHVAVLLGDHPALTGPGLAAVLPGLLAAAPAVVPDADGTGTALLVAPLQTGQEVPTRFGAGSAAAHRALGYREQSPDAPGLRTDVDDAASLADAVELGLGRHSRGALARATLPGVQATIHHPPATSDDGTGSALLDDGLEVRVPLDSVVDSGLLHLRPGQRVSIELDATGRTATRVWVVGIGPGETIR